MYETLTDAHPPSANREVSREQQTKSTKQATFYPTGTLQTSHQWGTDVRDTSATSLATMTPDADVRHAPATEPSIQMDTDTADTVHAIYSMD